MKHVILVTGTRRRLAANGIAVVVDVLAQAVAATNHPQVLFVHGACPTGVDAIVEATFYPATLPFPARWKEDGYPQAGPIRNEVMVKLVRAMADYGNPVTVVGFPSRGSRGARNCLDHARVARLDVIERPLPDIYLLPKEDS